MAGSMTEQADMTFKDRKGRSSSTTQQESGSGINGLEQTSFWFYGTAFNSGASSDLVEWDHVNINTTKKIFLFCAVY